MKRLVRRRKLRVYVNRIDGIHVFALGRHLHVFVWTRGHRWNPVYVSCEPFDLENA